MSESGVLQQLLSERILVLEGPKGTMIQRSGLGEADYRGERFADSGRDLRNNNETLNLVNPGLIQGIHLEFLRAGADIVTTNTFNANAISQSDFGLEALVPEMNRAAVQIARDAVAASGRPAFVAGTVGPTNRTASISPDVLRPGYRAVTFDDLVRVYGEQMLALVGAGVDLLLVETAFDTLNLKAALFAASRTMETLGTRVPVVASGTITDRSGRTLSGQSVEAFWTSLSHWPLLAVGLNCALGAHEMRAHIEALSDIAECAVACYPNAGLPNEFGGYDETPEQMAAMLGGFAERGWINIAGGCCGSTPAHIAAIAAEVRAHSPRPIPSGTTEPRYSGLDLLRITGETNLIMVGERTNVTGSPKFAKAIRAQDMELAVSIAAQQVRNGANVIDVCMDEALLDGPAVMTEFLNTVAADPDIAAVPVMVDSSNWDVLEAGLKCLQGKGIVNSLSLKEGEAAFMARARRVRDYGAAMVVMAFDEDGQAADAERKVAVCRRAYEILTARVGVPPQDIIFDPNVLTVGTGIEEHADYAVAFIEAVRGIKEACPGALVSGGISNVSFAFRGNNAVREAMHAVFLYHSVHAGLDMAIVNAGLLGLYEEIPGDLRELVEDLLLNRRPDATERLLGYTGVGGGTAAKERDLSWRQAGVDERLSHALVKGDLEFLEEDVMEALGLHGRPLSVIEGPLMAGMSTVGALFADGRMFLPQVVKSARAMKKAVAILLPHMAAGADEADGRPAEHRPLVLLATVKGDVHDIGKNIVGVVLSCNNAEVVDLGVMVSAETILSEATRLGADIIGLSGLITPSLDEMAHVAAEMEQAGMTIPLLIGGATTSRIHTAVKIAPRYSGPVVHVSDAGKAATVVSSLESETQEAGFVEANRADQVAAREVYARRNQARTLVSLAEARRRRPGIDWVGYAPPVPCYLGVRTETVPLDQLVPYIDWTPFFHAWELHGRYPDILTDAVVGEKAAELHRDALELLGKIVREEALQARATRGFWPAWADGDDIVLGSPSEPATEVGRFHMLRQQTDKGPGQVNYSLADYIVPGDQGMDFIGLFAVTSGHGLSDLIAQFRADHDDYSAIQAELLADRLAEALAEYCHAAARSEWGFGDGEQLSHADLIREKYRGIRPAPGYPACPDHTAKVLLMGLLDAQANAGIELTSGFAMSPVSSVSGFYFSHAEARYFPVGPIGRDQVEEYASRRGVSMEEAERSLRPNLAYDG